MDGTPALYGRRDVRRYHASGAAFRKADETVPMLFVQRQSRQSDDGRQQPVGKGRAGRNRSAVPGGIGKFKLATETAVRLKKGRMLYERWQKVIQDRRNEVALRDLASGRSWTFAQMDREAETPLPGEPAIVFPNGHSPEFIFTVLRAWRQRITRHSPFPLRPSPVVISRPRRPPPVCRARSPSPRNNWLPMPKTS